MTVNNREERIDSIVDNSYDGEVPDPATPETGEVAKRVLNVLQTETPGIFPDTESGGIRIEWATPEHLVSLVITNDETTGEFGEGEFYWLFRKS